MTWTDHYVTPQEAAWIPCAVMVTVAEKSKLWDGRRMITRFNGPDQAAVWIRVERLTHPVG